MIQEEKQLLLKDLCGRLTYGVKASSPASHLEINTIDGYFVDGDGRKMFHLSEPDFWQTVDNFQYYLRPLSSMTEEEVKDLSYRILQQPDLEAVRNLKWFIIEFADLGKLFDWLNSHHFDYRGLIEKGLAIEAPKDMYKTE